MKAFCVFNNKGGVGKTTLLCNLAAHYALKGGKKVLVVDADPQCNATAYMFKEKILDDLYSSSKDGETINQLVTSLKKSKGYSEIPIKRSESFGVDVVPGDPRFSLAEDFLAKDWVDATSGQERGLKTTFLFRALLEWASKKKYDYVFFDIGPSLGAINRTVLLSCDYFILPMSSDIFSLRGLQNIEVAITSWTKGLERGLTSYKEDNNEDFLFDGLHRRNPQGIKFLGYVTQQYTAKTVAGKKQPVDAYEKIIKRIGPAIRKSLIEKINQGQSLEYKLGEIPYFSSLVPMAQTSTKPIFMLKSADGVVGAHFDKVKQFEKVISDIAASLSLNMDEII
ncbi:chromosome partitioning protein ParA [Pseudomonas sp. Cab53]|uniref:ParA family protein n=1 Tax=Pseudomonas sp. Cab53 TaxID=2678258 RepID=UPI001BB43758|nr:AAA family ATPase [Pseudomonas sp. Cab53]BBP67900.1 chromosome partitioning protein ParA [Pseudomonas sp. Cab53]